MDISLLKKLEGKSLLWTGFDEAQGLYYLIFEDLSAIAIERCIPVEDGAGLAQTLVSQNLDFAQNILKLNLLLTAGKKVPHDGDSCLNNAPQEADPQVSGPGA